MTFLHSIRLKGPLSVDDPEESIDQADVYPFVIPVVQSMGDMNEVVLDAPVTFFVGENGSGKSTILEAIAAAVGSITIGSADVETDPSLVHARRLAKHLVVSWRRRTHRGFFMRSEDFFNYARRTRELVEELDELADGYATERETNPDRSYGLGLAEGATRNQRDALVRRYGEDLHARSHGESFFDVFQARFVPGGLYLMDEPDTALSPQRQLALLALLKEMVAQDAQFIIATHAPILLAYPGATILSFDSGTITETTFDEVANVALTRAFLADPASFLRRL